MRSLSRCAITFCSARQKEDRACMCFEIYLKVVRDVDQRSTSSPSTPISANDGRT